MISLNLISILLNFGIKLLQSGILVKSLIFIIIKIIIYNKDLIYLY
jgi:hypothetical protein